jgi:predicted RNase H-like HicB family nuclease
VLYFLFLHELRVEGKLTGKTIEDVMAQIKQRISKYAKGSE